MTLPLLGVKNKSINENMEANDTNVDVSLLLSSFLFQCHKLNRFIASFMFGCKCVFNSIISSRKTIKWDKIKQKKENYFEHFECIS